MNAHVQLHFLNFDITVIMIVMAPPPVAGGGIKCFGNPSVVHPLTPGFPHHHKFIFSLPQ